MLETGAVLAQLGIGCNAVLVALGWLKKQKWQKSFFISRQLKNGLRSVVVLVVFLLYRHR